METRTVVKIEAGAGPDFTSHNDELALVPSILMTRWEESHCWFWGEVSLGYIRRSSRTGFFGPIRAKSSFGTGAICSIITAGENLFFFGKIT